MDNENKSFHYTYQAPTEAERREISDIRRRYAPPPEREGKLARLRYLHACVQNTATALGLAVGVVGCLIFGLGMAMVLEWGMIVWGVIVAAVGAAPMLAAYPLYRAALHRGEKRHGEEILRLSEELLNE